MFADIFVGHSRLSQREFMSVGKRACGSRSM
jgi:hypothetical protein